MLREAQEAAEAARTLQGIVIARLKVAGYMVSADAKDGDVRETWRRRPTAGSTAEPVVLMLVRELNASTALLSSCIEAVQSERQAAIQLQTLLAAANDEMHRALLHIEALGTRGGPCDQLANSTLVDAANMAGGCEIGQVQQGASWHLADTPRGPSAGDSLSRDGSDADVNIKTSLEGSLCLEALQSLPTAGRDRQSNKVQTHSQALLDAGSWKGTRMSLKGRIDASTQTDERSAESTHAKHLATVAAARVAEAQALFQVLMRVCMCVINQLCWIPSRFAAADASTC
jgi:hypothetical protein